MGECKTSTRCGQPPADGVTPVGRSARAGRVARVATLALLALLFAVSAARLEAYLGEYDEGPLLQAAALANRGYSLYSEVVANKPPLLIWWLQLGLALGGETLAVARLWVLLITLIGGAALAALAESQFGPWAGPLALVALLAMPGMVPRLVCVTHDLPAASLAIVALWAAARSGKSGLRGTPVTRWRRCAWAALAGAASGLAVGLHPLVAGVALPALALLVLPELRAGPLRAQRLRAQHLRALLAPVLLAGLAGVVATAAWLLPVVSAGFVEWVLRYNASDLGPALAAMGRDDDLRLWIYFGVEHWPVSVATLLSSAALLMARRRRPNAIVVVGWLAVVLCSIVGLRPMWDHYLLLPLLPASVLIGGGGAQVVHRAMARARAAAVASGSVPPRGALRRRAARAVAGAVAFALVGVHFVTVPRASEPWPQADLALYRYLRAVVPRGAMVVTDHPLVAFMSGLVVPPSLADTSVKRISTRFLDTADVLNATLRYEPRRLVFAYARLARLQPLVTWAEAHATEVTIPGDRSADLRVFVLPDVPEAAVALEARVGASMRLTGYRLEAGGALETDGTVPAHATLALTLFWELVPPSPSAAPPLSAPPSPSTAMALVPDAHIFVHVVDAAGRVVAQSDAPPLGGALRTPDWEPGVSVPHTVTVAGLPPGVYTVLAGMYTWPDVVRLPVVLAGGERAPDDAIPLFALQVNG